MRVLPQIVVKFWLLATEQSPIAIARAHCIPAATPIVVDDFWLGLSQQFSRRLQLL